jgi:hypothetical protein
MGIILLRETLIGCEVGYASNSAQQRGVGGDGVRTVVNQQVTVHSNVGWVGMVFEQLSTSWEL